MDDPLGDACPYLRLLSIKNIEFVADANERAEPNAE